MVACAYCDKPLHCDNCRAEYVPPTEDHYLALSRPEVPLSCPACGEILVCHWCRTPYDGGGEGEADPEGT